MILPVGVDDVQELMMCSSVSRGLLGKHTTSPSSITNGWRRRTEEALLRLPGDKVLYFLFGSSCLN